MKNRYSIWRLMSLGAALMTAPWLQAQDVLVTLEAEKGIITLPAKVKPVDGSTVEGISGGKYVGDNDPGSSIVFNDVEVPEAGTYEFKTYYMRADMDDYLALSLIIMGIAIGALLVIWGAMSLAFFLRKKHRAKKIQERIAERKAAEAKYRAELQQEEQNSQNDN